jgi:hypothetical protein
MKVVQLKTADNLAERARTLVYNVQTNLLRAMFLLGVSLFVRLRLRARARKRQVGPNLPTRSVDEPPSIYPICPSFTF